MSEPADDARRRSTRAGDKARTEALERLKAIRRSGGRRSTVGFQVKLDEPIYDTVGEEDYEKLVAKRQEAVRGFIVDDDGLGYGDEGQEEDWACSGLPPSSDEDEIDDGGEKARKKKAVKKEGDVKKKPAPTSLSAAAAMMGKQRLSTMFTGSTFRRNERGKGTALSAETMVDDLIAEFAPDQADREERRRRRGPVPVPQSVSVKHAIDIPNETPVWNEIPSILDDRVPGTEVAADMVITGIHTGAMENNTATGKDDLCGEMKGQEVVDNKVNSNVIWNGHMDVAMCNTDDMESACSSKPEMKTTLNAKIKVDNDEKVASAIAGWKAVCGGEAGGIEAKIVESGQSSNKSDLKLSSDGTLPFYLIDAHEESYGPNSGTVYLFGKVKTGSSYHSCCITVKSMQRCIYAIPNANVFQNDEIIKLEKSVAGSKISKISFCTKLQEMASELKSEIAKRLINHNISSFSMMPVKRGYAFERMDIPVGEQYVLKINYPFKDPSLPSDLKGDLFNCLLGTNTSVLELFLIKRNIMGPSWLTISRFTISPSHERISWCRYEIVVDCPKDIVVSTSKTLIEIPPVVVTALNLKTMISEKHNANEIVSASVICCHKAKIDGPMMASDWKRPDILSHFTILRKLEGGIFPLGFTKEVSDRNSKVGTNTLLVESSERALLNRLMIELHKLDTDILVGHNISGFDLDVLLHRAQVCKVSSSMWSKIGRLKRMAMPRLTKGSSLYGSGASPGIMSCIAGRLLCDTYLSARDLLREVSYSLTELAKTQLNKNRKEITPHDIPAMFQISGKLLELVDLGETDAWLSLELMFHLSILPLTRQLTNISGNLWGKTLQGARAQRVEYLLLHTFHAKKYIVPDKSHTKSKTPITTKRKVNAIPDGESVDNLNRDNVLFDDDAQYIEQAKSKKGPAYAGGLVLEPRKGLYDKIVLLLDFNSLYPSIIQEYNICFTTIERSLDGLPPSLPSSRTVGVLPEILKNLVERRKTVKSWLKNASGLKAQQLDIQQQALKLTANSMYGCLGFSNSRFYAKPIAELITLQGREILQSTVDLVQNLLNLEVIYGDTDSIMIYSGLDDISKAKALAGKVIQEVNKKYRCLEIAIDGLYKRMLLLKKKKYAAVKLQFKDGKAYEVIERKGIDIVRRDWSLLAKESGEFCLLQILSGGSCDDVVETIHDYLMKIQEDMRNGEIELSKYVITKTLTKSPEDYPDGKNQPHVQVALRLKKSGHSTGCSSGDTVPYVICRDQDTVSSSSGGIAERARHPDELKRNNGNWMIDIDYYLSQQIHPVASRLCASIQGTSPARLADCLGLDSSKFQHTTESTAKDPTCVLASILDDDDRYHGCEPLRFSCPSCSSSFDCPPISCLLSSLGNNLIEIEKDKEHVSSFWHRIRCPRCPDGVDGSRLSSAMIANQLKRQADNFISVYYKGLMTCDDETCKYTTRYPNLRVIGDSERGTVCPNYPRCNGHLIRQYTEAELYKQLSYFCHIFDAKRCIEKLDKDNRLAFEKELTRLYPIINLASTTIQKIRDRCAYGWVQLEDLTVSV